MHKLRRADELAAEGKTGEEIAAELGVSGVNGWPVMRPRVLRGWWAMGRAELGIGTVPAGNRLARKGHIWRGRPTGAGVARPMAAPELFDLPDGAEQAVVLDADPPESERDRAVRAAAMCPALAIQIS